MTESELDSQECGQAYEGSSSDVTKLRAVESGDETHQRARGHAL